MDKNSSPFDDIFSNFLFNIKNSFRSHDRYLNIGLLLSFVPLPFVGFVALSIALIGIYFNYRGKFQIDESRRLILILIVSILNISLSMIFAVNAYSFVNDIFIGIGDFFGNIISFIFSTTNTYI
jgi:hypothetical protein